MTTELMSLESSKKGVCNLERWSKDGKMLMVDLYVDREDDQWVFSMIVNDTVFKLDQIEYNMVCSMLKKNGFKWSYPQ